MLKKIIRCPCVKQMHAFQIVEGHARPNPDCKKMLWYWRNH